MTGERVISSAVGRPLKRSACDVSVRKAATIGYDEGARNGSRVVLECEFEGFGLGWWYLEYYLTTGPTY